MSEKSYIIKRGLWDSRPRKLLLTNEYIEFEDKIVGEGKPIRIEKGQIKEYRFGIVWLKGLKFYIGRQYQIYIRTHDERELKIDFLTFYGINKNELSAKYIDIVKNIFTLYFTDIVKGFLEKYYNGETIEICSVKINKDFVTIQSDGLFKTISNDIPWEKLKTKSYKTYYAVYSSENTADINKSYKFLDDYNTSILRCVLDTIVQSRNADK